MERYDILDEDIPEPDLHPSTKGIWETEGNNIGVFLGSAISALLFIIHLDDMMGDMEAINRRTKLPMRIAQDRPHAQKRNTMERNTSSTR